MMSASNKPVIAADFSRDLEKAAIVDEKAILKKLNRYILLKFFAMTILCYLGKSGLHPNRFNP